MVRSIVVAAVLAAATASVGTPRAAGNRATGLAAAGPSHSLRPTRGSGTSIADNELIAYRSAGAARAALDEIGELARNCPHHPVPAIDGLSYLPPLTYTYSVIRIRGLTANHVAVAATVTGKTFNLATLKPSGGPSTHHDVLIYQVRGNVLSGVASGRAASRTARLRFATRLAQLSAAKLEHVR